MSWVVVPPDLSFRGWQFLLLICFHSLPMMKAIFFAYFKSPPAQNNVYATIGMNIFQCQIPL